MGKTGFTIAWTDYQQMIVNKLNQLVAGEPYENTDPKSLIIQYARDPENVSLFNHASMAHNNYFFFSTLSTAPQWLERTRLHKQLIAAFGSIETLKMTMLDTAASMFGPGFVWLVYAKDTGASPLASTRSGGWRILSTYGAGTPYPEAGFRLQPFEPNTYGRSDYVSNTVGAMGRLSKPGQEAAQIPPGGTSLVPVLCVNTWEHVYIYDFGISGKRRYLNDWWKSIDWGVVENNAPSEAFSIQDDSR
jgi:superoxide dismutase, Fe-Mn family